MSKKPKTPAEIQAEYQRVMGKKINMPPPCRDVSQEEPLIHPRTVAIEAIEKGASFIAFIDDGHQLTMHADGLSQLSIVGILYSFLERVSKQVFSPGTAEGDIHGNIH